MTLRATPEQRDLAWSECRQASSWAVATSTRAASIAQQLQLARLGLGGPAADVMALARELDVARKTAAVARREAASARRVAQLVG
jgi:hypothetical protein